MAETKRRIIVDGIDLPQLFQFPKLFRAVPLALTPPRLMIAFFMVVLLAVAGSIWDGATAPRDEQGNFVGVTVLTATGAGVFDASVSHIMSSVERVVRGVFVFNLFEVGRAVADVAFWLPIALWMNHPFFTIVFALIGLVLAAIGGGAIARMTAAEIAGIERLRVRDALQFSMTSWLRLVAAPLLPLVAVAVLSLIVALVGILTNWLVTDVIAAILYGLMLLFCFVIAFLLIAYIAAGPMIIPAIACENCDASDAMQRSYAYVVSRPLHLLGYGIVTAVAFALGFLLVSLFAWAILNLTGALFAAWTTSPAAGTAGGYVLFDLFGRPQPAAVEGATEVATAWLIGFWETIVLGLVAAFVVAFAFNAATIFYLLMRRASDGQSLEEIWRPGLVPGTLARMPEMREKVESGE